MNGEYDTENTNASLVPVTIASEDNLDVQFFIDQISEKYLIKIKEDRDLSDQKQIREMSVLMKDWADKITATTKDIVSTIQQSSNNNGDSTPIDGIVDDIKDRQSKMIMAIQDAHNRQMEILKGAITEERKESAQAQLIFEQTLKTRYECMVDALHEKVKAEQEARMQRALDNLERSARIESERAKQSFDVQQEAEITLSKKFRSIVSDLRRSWEEEEVGRAMQLEERLRSHYSVVLEHMESQLKMALQLQDDADRQWVLDVESRNRQQLNSLRAFEEKCRRLYDTRLTEFADKTSYQIAEYEDQLLEAGRVVATEKSQFESRLRRIKLACSRWKVSYQKDIHERYQSMTSTLEEQYTNEIARLLQEINEGNVALAEAHRDVETKEREIIRTREANSSDPDYLSAVSAQTMREELVGRWNELKVPVAERVDALVALLDAAKATPQMLATYEAINSKLSARQPIAQLISRKQYIEYKLKLASRIGGENNLSASDRAQLITELTELQSNADQLVRQFEKKYGESYFKGSSAQPLNGVAPSLQQLSQLSPQQHNAVADTFPSTPYSHNSPALSATVPHSNVSSVISSFNHTTPNSTIKASGPPKPLSGMGRK